jgi:16S rRNA (guanine1516-N2)-methyltransferase
MKKNHIAASITTIDQLEQGQTLANSLQLPFIADFQSDTAKEYDYLLLLTPDYLGLQKTTDKKLSPFYIDFLSGKMLYRSQHAGLRKELLARAIGFKPGDHPRIIDTTAGLGRDSFILATLGFEVTMVEQSPILHALLIDGLNRARQNPLTSEIIHRLKLIHADSKEWLTSSQNNPKPDVIYLDPMFPERKKSASVKKEMVILHNVLGKASDDDAALLEVALTCAAKRVVVKRPRLAAYLTARVPNFSVTGKNSRFDIYLV